MVRVHQGLVLLLVAGIPAAMPLIPATSQDLCVTAGPVTYRLSQNVPAPDVRVRIDNDASHPDLHVRLVDRAEIADLALVDDAGHAAGHSCAVMGDIRTGKIVTGLSDVTVAVSREEHAGDYALYVNSAHISHQDAAALFALMRHVENRRTLARLSAAPQSLPIRQP
jgi:hypothetical protein